ncbi:hypothetical protein [Clostridium sp.]|uniref:hypothetical protein n=1 Tax=Clostridium sp. TaxID=1506 RepID=UPI001A52DB55|nr:hypothetical protein [Clostridium sp.]MBK5236832.1 hypothetical protein [Clostridium sp.]
MRKNKVLVIFVVLVMLLSLNLSVYADAGNYENDIDIKRYQEDVKARFSRSLDEHYKIASLDLNGSNVIKREVLINGFDDIDLLERSLVEPVVIYKEKVIIDSADEDSEYMIMSVGSDSDPETISILFQGAEIFCSGNFTADYIDNESTVIFYKAKYLKHWWSSDDTATVFGDVPSVDKIVKQVGYPYSGDDQNPVDWEHTTYNPNPSTYYTTNFSPSTYSGVTPITGLCGAHLDFHCAFERIGYPAYHDDVEINLGWGEITSIF